MVLSCDMSSSSICSSSPTVHSGETAMGLVELASDLSLRDEGHAKPDHSEAAITTESVVNIS